jgi:hypothetical protein
MMVTIPVTFWRAFRTVPTGMPLIALMTACALPVVTAGLVVAVSARRGRTPRASARLAGGVLTVCLLAVSLVGLASTPWQVTFPNTCLDYGGHYTGQARPIW